MRDNTVSIFAMKVQPKKEFEKIPDGVHSATLRKIDIETGVQGKDGTYDRIRWFFRIDGKEFDVRGFTSTTVNEMSKAYKWAAAIVGRNPREGEDLMGLIIERPCKIKIKNVSAERRDGTTGIFANIEDVMKT